MKKILGKIFLLGIAFSLIPVLSSGFNKDPISAGEEEELKEEFVVHMLSLGGEGDCSLITYGKTDILIDAGGVRESASRIKANLDEYVKDKVLEYVIFSHADEDHVNCASTALGNWLDEGGEIGLLVDFDLSEDSTCKHPKKQTFFSSSPQYAPYVNNFRNKYRNNQKIKRYVPVGLFNWKKRGIDPSAVNKSAAGLAQEFNSSSKLGNEYELPLDPSHNSPYVLANSSSKATIKFLYNYYYDNAISGNVPDVPNSAEKNVISVCTMLKLKRNGDGYKRILYNGDLEEYAFYPLKRITDGTISKGGEGMLISLNEEEFNEPITFYKASHHGSNTSNDPSFLERIRPNYIGINAVAGGQYGFPSQNMEMADSSSMIEMTKYTDRIYITDMRVPGQIKGEYETEPYYGNIVFRMSETEESVTFQNPETLRNWTRNKSIFADQIWFRTNRLYEADIINLTVPGRAIVNLTYIKLGHIDIVIGAGYNPTIPLSNVELGYLKEKLSFLCNDGVLEYLIIPALSVYSYGILDSVVDAPGIKSIDNTIYFLSDIQDNTFGKMVKEVKNIFDSSDKIRTSWVRSFKNGQSIFLLDGSLDYSLSFFGNPSSTKNMPSFYTVFKAEDYYYLHCGDNCRYDESDELMSSYRSKINTFQMAKCGEFYDLDPQKPGSIGSFESFYDSMVNGKADHNVLINNALHLKDGKLNNNVLPQFKLKLIKGGLYPTKVLKGGELVHKSGQDGNTINGDIVSRALIKFGTPDVRVATSRGLKTFSLCDSSCSKRSDIHKKSYAVKLDDDSFALL